MLEQSYETYGPQDVEYVTLLTQDGNSAPATADTVQQWISTHSLTHTVVATDNNETVALWNPFLGYPSIKLIKQGMIVHNADLWPYEHSAVAEIVP